MDDEMQGRVRALTDR